jgi:uncharacterized pyridoxamine 5'-phosphate oxidase family protein
MVNSNKKIVFNVKPIQIPDIYVLRFAPDQAITLIIDSNSQIIVHINNYPYNQNYSIENSTGSQLVKENTDIINKHIDIFEEAYSNYRSAPRDDNYKKLRNYTDSILRQNQIDLYYELKNSIVTNPTSFASILAIYSRFGNNSIFDMEIDSSLFIDVSNALIDKYPNNNHVLFMKNNIDDLLTNIKLKEIRESKLDKGNIFPDISLISLDNQQYFIKNTHSKYIFIYLWKSKYKKFWEINPILKDLYNKYDRDNLEIIGISFEKDKLSWANYCSMEKMNWINLISSPENEKYINPDGKYPRVFILDSNFKILNKNASIDDLKSFLK